MIIQLFPDTYERATHSTIRGCILYSSLHAISFRTQGRQQDCLQCTTALHRCVQCAVGVPAKRCLKALLHKRRKVRCLRSLLPNATNKLKQPPQLHNLYLWRLTRLPNTGSITSQASKTGVSQTPQRLAR